MARIDDPTIRNPFGWRIADLADPATDPIRRLALSEELLVCEAEELAHSHRHLTVVHGNPTDVAASRHLSGLYDTLGRLAQACAWVRVRGDVDYVTVTVRGCGADEQLAAFAAAAEAANPGGWVVVVSAVPPLT
jgi:hypothetical protein